MAFLTVRKYPVYKPHTSILYLFKQIKYFVSIPNKMAMLVRLTDFAHMQQEVAQQALPNTNQYTFCKSAHNCYYSRQGQTIAMKALTSAKTIGVHTKRMNP